MLLGDYDGDLELFLRDFCRGILVHSLKLTGRTFEVLTLYKRARSCKKAFVLFILKVTLGGLYLSGDVCSKGVTEGTERVQLRKHRGKFYLEAGMGLIFESRNLSSLDFGK